MNKGALKSVCKPLSYLLQVQATVCGEIQTCRKVPGNECSMI